MAEEHKPQHTTEHHQVPHYPPAIDSSSPISSSSLPHGAAPPGHSQHPPQGYPPQGYPPQGYPPQSYIPPTVVGGPNPSQQPGSNPTQVGYLPQGYPPQQPGSTTTQQQHPPQGYPPQQGGYPPQQPGSNPTQQPQGYPSQGGYPPQQQGYPPQQPGSNPTQQPQGYPPQQGGYPPQGYGQLAPPQHQGLGGFPPGVFPVGVEITFRAYTGKYLTAEKPKNVAVCNATKPDVWERWQVFSGSNGGVCFRSWHGRYLSSDAKDKVMANAEKPQEWESFTPILAPGQLDVFFLRTYNGNFLSADTKGNVLSSKTQKSNEQWSIEVVGAATQLPGSRRLTLPQGRIHLKSRYNTYLNAAPDDGVVHADAKKPSGWESFEVIFQKEGKISLMGCSGKYLTVNEKGLVTATAEIARGWEFWESVHHAGAQFNLKSYHGTFLGANKKGQPKMYKDNEDSDTIWTVERAAPQQ